MHLSLTKKILLAAFFCCSFLLHIHAQNNKQGFVIKGHIEGIADNTKVYLFDIDEQVIIDSAPALKGNFILRGRVKRPTTCWLECKDQYAILQVENTSMEFNSPIENMRLYATVKGGKEQALQNELIRLQFPYDKVYMSAYDSIQQKKYVDEPDRKRLIKLFNTAQDLSQHIYIEFGKQHPNSWIGLDIIYRNRERIATDTLRMAYNQLDSSLRNSTKALAIATYLYGELAAMGKPFIDFTAQTLDNRVFRLSSLKGNYILLNFWSAGCAPCREENKKISMNYDKFDKKLSIVSFSIDKNKDTWMKASKSDNIVWTNVSDLQGDNGVIKTKYGVQAIPTSFLIDKDGLIVEKFTGFDQDFNNKVNKLLK